MRGGTIRAGLAALIWLLALAVLPVTQTVAQVTCPSAANDETLNIVTTGGVTTCTNIGTAAATEGIEIRNNLVQDLDLLGPGSGGERFGVAFRRITTGGNEQPTAAGCVGACSNRSGPDVGFDPDSPVASASGVALDWGYGTGISTLVQCLSGYQPSMPSCTVSFEFADGTTGAFTVAGGSTVIPSFSLGGTVALPPTITSVTPSAITLGETVTIVGTRLDTVTAIHHDSDRQTNYQIISSTEIRLVPTQHNPTNSTLQLSSPAGTATSTLVVAPVRVSISTTSLPSGLVGSNYSTAISVTGGTKSHGSPDVAATSYGYSATGLPAGLSLNGSGVISGQPTQSGTFSVTVTVADPGTTHFPGGIWPPTTASRTFSLTIASAVSVTTSSLAAGTVGATYTAPLAATGGTAPYTFISDGLPAGLAVSGASITGTPTEAGTFGVSFIATDSSTPTPLSSAGVTLSLVIALPSQAAQTITFTKPPDVIYTSGLTVALTASASSGLAVTFTSLTTGVCTVSGSTATILTAGTCTIKASQAGNASHAAAEAIQSFAVLGAPAITAEATVSPTSFSRPGETLVFQITLRNSGGSLATGVRLAEPRLTGITCAGTSVPANGTLACQGSTLTTAADLAAGKVSISPQLTYTYGEAQP